MYGNDVSFSGGAYFLFRQVNGVLASTPVRLPSTASVDKADAPDVAIAADVNGDGKPDLVGIRSGGLLGYFEWRQGELSQEQHYSGPYATWSGETGISVGDLNGDGCRDVATANNNYGLVVWKGAGCDVKRTAGQRR